jgi:outer membrane immunogenic protein
MKKFLLSSVALLGLTAGAMAADLPRRAAPPVFAPVPVFTWTGFYVGVNAGYGWGDDDNGFFGGTGALTVDVAPGVVAPVTAAPFSAIPATGGFGGGGNRDGFVGGAQVGFNYQFTPGSGFVVGVEADIQWADFGGGNNNGFFGSNLFAANPVAPFATPGFGIVAVPPTGANVALFNRGGFGRGNDNDWFGTARVRVGYAFDRVLVYATGGFAFTDGGNNNRGFGGITNGGQLPAAFYVSPGAALTGSFVNGGGGLFGKNGSNDVGWVLGGGVEYAWTNNLTVKLEGLWVSMDDNNNRFGFGNGIVGVSNTGAAVRGNTGGFGGNNNDGEFFIARVGINYKFGM